jgi:hypothetical protein
MEQSNKRGDLTDTIAKGAAWGLAYVIVLAIMAIGGFVAGAMLAVHVAAK